MGASTGICAEAGPPASLRGIPDSEDLHALLGGVEIRTRLIAIRFSLLQIAQSNGVVLIQVLGAGVVGLSERDESAALR